MKLQKQDMKRLRWPLVAALLFTVIGGTTLWYADRQFTDAKAKEAEAQRQRTSAQERVSKASEEEREIRDHLVYYQRMVNAGMVGSQNRLDLIDKIAAIKSQRKLFEVKYNIQPQKAVDYPGIVSSGAMDFVTNRMTLDMQLLHEEDLLDFLRDLQNAGQSLVSVRHCKMSRLDRGSNTALTPGLQAQCVIDLINLV